MPNPHRGEYTAEINGETRVLRFSLNKLANLQEKLGVKSINEVVSDLNDLSFASLRYLIWLAVNEQDPETKEWTGPSEWEVGEWELDMESLSEHLRNALALAFRGGRVEGDEDEEEDGAEAPDPPAQAEAETSPTAD
jgi:hypothetical protein